MKQKPVKNTYSVFLPVFTGFAGKAGKGRQKRVFRPFSAGERRQEGPEAF